jgi:hypothetical protein
MRRREFLGLVSVVAACPVTALFTCTTFRSIGALLLMARLGPRILAEASDEISAS